MVHRTIHTRHQHNETVHRASRVLLLDIHLVPFNPFLTLPIQDIMLHPIYISFLPRMPRHIQHYLHPHRLFLTVRQIFISHRKPFQLLLIQPRHLFRINDNQLILLIPMPHKSRPPFPTIFLVLLRLFPKRKQTDNLPPRQPRSHRSQSAA